MEKSVHTGEYPLGLIILIKTSWTLLVNFTFHIEVEEPERSSLMRILLSGLLIKFSTIDLKKDSKSKEDSSINELLLNLPNWEVILSKLSLPKIPSREEINYHLYPYKQISIIKLDLK